MYKVFIYLSLIILCIACEDVYDFPGKGNYQKIPVIEAIITGQPGYQKVRVSYATQLDDSILSLPITNALVMVTNGTGDTMNFSYTQNGWYTRDDFVAKPQNNYTLLVQIDSALYRSTSSMVSMHGLDSVTYSFHKKTNASDSAYFLKIYAGTTDPNDQKYYQIQIYKNHQLVTTGEDILLLSDIGTFSLNGVELSLPFAKNDTLDVGLYSLTKEMFNYHLYVINSLVNNSNYVLDFKNNPSTQFAPEALGYFQVSQISNKSIVIR